MRLRSLLERRNNAIIFFMKLSGSHAAVTIIALGGVIALYSLGAFAGPCEQPVAYRVGEVDSRFGISTSTVRDLLFQAEEVWETSIDRDLFVYDPEADFVVNFIFDDRQETTEQVNQYELTLSDLEASHDEIIAAHKQARDEYESSLSRYEEQKNQYDENLSNYNEKVDEWNDRGGAPADVRAELAEERDLLEEQQQQLQSFQDDLETLRRQVNELADRGNTLAEEYNETAGTFSDRFGESHEFNQATYVGGEINVYQYEGEDDLLLALTHEFGHALGLEHVSSSDSIMHYLMEDQPLDQISLSAEDQVALRNLCGDA